MATADGHSESEDKCCCLYRLDGKKTTQLITLSGQESVTIGRQEDNDYVLDESPAVSRKHARLKKDDKGWTIHDAGSSNGVWINGVRIGKTDAHRLHDRDIVEIGKDPKDSAPSLYRYRFYKQAKLKKRKANDPDHSDPEAGPSRAPKDVPRLRRLREEATLSTALLRQKMMEQEDRLQQEFGEKQKAAEEALNEMRAQLDQKAKEQEELEQRIEKQQALERAMEGLRAELASKEAAQEELQKTVEEKRAEVEAQLEEQKRQQDEARKLREDLQREMDQKLKEEGEKHAAEIQTRIEGLSSMLEAKEQQQRALQEQLGTLKTEVEENKKHVEAKDQIVSSVQDAMEDELVCAICAELLVQATSLNCSHSFCWYCIQKWMTKKKECPNCRKAITSTVHSLVLDNYIDKVVTLLSQEMQEGRKEMVESRKEEQRLFDAEVAADVVIIDDDGATAPPALREVTVAAGPTYHATPAMDAASLMRYLDQNPQTPNQMTYIIPIQGQPGRGVLNAQVVAGQVRPNAAQGVRPAQIVVTPPVRQNNANATAPRPNVPATVIRPNAQAARPAVQSIVRPNAQAARPAVQSVVTRPNAQAAAARPNAQPAAQRPHHNPPAQRQMAAAPNPTTAGQNQRIASAAHTIRQLIQSTVNPVGYVQNHHHYQPGQPVQAGHNSRYNPQQGRAQAAAPYNRQQGNQRTANTTAPQPRHRRR